MGRTGEVGDDLGSAVIAARLARDIMRLCFLIERRYAPYAKWLGTAFAQLDCGPTLAPMLREALAATGWQAREAALVPAFEHVAGMFNALGVTEPQETGACVTSMTGHSACSGRDGSSRRAWRRRHSAASAMRAASINSRTTRTC